MGFCSQCYKRHIALTGLLGELTPECSEVVMRAWDVAKSEALHQAEEDYAALTLQQLNKLKMSDSELNVLVNNLREKSLTCFMRTMFQRITQAQKSVTPCLPQFLLSVGQLRWLVSTLDGVVFPQEVGDRVGGFQLHIFCLDQTVDWTAELIDTGSKYLAKYSSPNMGSSRSVDVSLSLEVPDSVDLSSISKSVSFQVPGANYQTVLSLSLQVPDSKYQTWRLEMVEQMQVLERDPCNFLSIYRRRQQQIERLLALAMGMHPRLGGASPVMLPRDILQTRIAPFILSNDLFSDIKWLHHNNAWRTLSRRNYIGEA